MGEIGDQPGAPGNSGQVGVVGNHDHSILRKMDIHLQDVGTGIEGSLEGSQGVLCVIKGKTAVGDDSGVISL